MTATVAESLLVYLLLIFGVLFTVVGALLSRQLRLRAIPAYDALPNLIGFTVESGKAMHVSFGGSAIRDDSTLSALASAEMLYHITERSAIGDNPTLVTVSDPLTLSLAQDTLRRAYKSRQRLIKYRPLRAQWYPQGESSLAFAAGAGLSLTDEQVSTNYMIGRFGAELALLAENALRTDQTLIAQSDRIEGQAVAYMISPTPLIGEEMYMSGAYLDPRPIMRGSALAIDGLRYLTVAFILLAAFYAFVTGRL